MDIRLNLKKNVSATLPQSNPFLAIRSRLVVSISHYFPLPFLAFHSTFSVFRSCLAFCPSLKIKTIKNLCLLNILLFKEKRQHQLSPFIFFSTEVEEYFPFSSFKLSDLKPAQQHYFVRLVADLLAWAQPNLLPAHLPSLWSKHLAAESPAAGPSTSYHHSLNTAAQPK